MGDLGINLTYAIPILCNNKFTISIAKKFFSSWHDQTYRYKISFLLER